MHNKADYIKSAIQYRIACAIFYFISGFGYATWASRIPTIKQQLHLNDAQLGTVLFALPVGLMLTMPITSKLLMHYSSRIIMLIGSLVLTVVLIMIGITNNIWQLIIILFCFGSARNLLTLSINTQGVAVQNLYTKSIMATFHGIWSMAGFAGAAFGLLMVYFNVNPFWHFLLVGVVLTIITFLTINHTYYQQPLPDNRKPVFSLPDKYLIKYSFICFACMACENTMYDWSALYFQKVVNPDKTMATAAFVIYLIAMTSGRFFGDKLVSKVGIKPVLRFSGIFIFSGLMLSVLLPYVFSVIVGFIMVGLGVSCIVPMVFSLAGKSDKMNSSSALASISTIGYLGFVLIPPFVGYISQLVSLRLSFGIIAFFGIIIMWLVLKIKDQ